MLFKIIKLLLIQVLLNVVSAQESCVLQNNRNGICKKVQECPSAVPAIRNWLKPEICRFVGREPIVCCPSSISQEKCAEYGEENKKNSFGGTVGVANAFAYHYLSVFTGIVGGELVSISKYPHMAALGYGEPNNIRWKCGGSLISHKFILTAAHCLWSDIGPVSFVRLGETNIDNTFVEGKDFRIIRTIRHPQYKPPAVYHDIALLEIDRRIFISSSIKPACLHTYLTPSDSDEIYATGWGASNFGEAGTTFLQGVKLQLFTNEECSASYWNYRRRIPQGVQFDKQLCAGGRDKSADTCQGDSGCPLQIYRPDEQLYGIIGVTSFGKGCGTPNVPGVYSRVSYYIPWIESNVWN